MQHPEDKEAREDLAHLLKSAGADHLWVFDDDLARVFDADTGSGAVNEWDVLSKRGTDVLLTQGTRACFYVRTAKGVIQMHGEPIRTRSSGRPANGYLVAGIGFDTSHLREIGLLTGGRASVLPSRPRASAGSLSAATTAVRVPLNGWDGKPAAYLQLSSPVSPSASRPLFNDTLAMVALTALLAVLAATSLHLWIGRPLRLLRRALESGETESVQRILADRSAIGAAARAAVEIVQTSRMREQSLEEVSEALLQQQALMKESEETRLALLNVIEDLRSGGPTRRAA